MYFFFLIPRILQFLFIISWRLCDVFQFVHVNKNSPPLVLFHQTHGGEMTVTFWSLKVDTMTLCCQSCVSCSSGRCTCLLLSACDDHLSAAGLRGLRQDFCACRAWGSSGCSSSVLLPAGPTCCVSGGRWVLSCSSFYCVVSELYRFLILPILNFVYKLAKEIKGELNCSEMHIFKYNL